MVRENDRYTDADLVGFLKELDDAVDEVEVTDWEARFIESAIKHSRLTPKQRDVVVGMIVKYGEKIKW